MQKSNRGRSQGSLWTVAPTEEEGKEDEDVSFSGYSLPTSFNKNFMQLFLSIYVEK
jgi:hypothetical protein